MLSQTTSTTASPRIHTHNRQQSTPTPLEAHCQPISPAHYPQHPQPRRGLSQTASPEAACMDRMGQDDVRQVGITNPGHPIQHHTQVAQQQCQARPGLQQPYPYNFHSEAGEEASQRPQSQPLIQHLSPEEFRKWQHQQLDAQLDSIMSNSGRASSDHSQPFLKVERSRSDMGHQYAPHGGAFSAGSHKITTAPCSEAGQRPSSSQSMNQMSFSQQWPAFAQRPFTPPLQGSQASYSPMTPAMSPSMHPSRPSTGFHTPAHPSSPHSQCNATVRPSSKQRSPQRSRPQSRVLQPTFEHDCDPNATVKPHSRSQPLRGDLFMPDDVQRFEGSLPSPPATAPVRHLRKFDVTALPDDDSLDDVPKLDLLPRGQFSNLAFFPPDHQMTGGEDELTSFEMQPEQTSNGQNFQPQTPSTSAAFHSARSSVDFGSFGSPTELVMSTAPMSISGLDLDEHVSIEDTGISSEEVNSYMEDDPSNIKTPWLCTFPECGKRFGRRENVRSHVQTHLNDRQFRCVHCSKRFVRQHDLKRHSKIHTKEKPYQCACGNGFARQDALTRHRQRGICTGSFEGVVRTPVKRGRPRKHRPNDDDRRDKAARTRKRNIDKAYASSVSGTSESSSFESPSPLLSDMKLDQGMADRDIQLLSGINSFGFCPMSPYAQDISGSHHGSGSSDAGKSSDPKQHDECFAPTAFQHDSELNNSAITVSMAQLSHDSQQSRDTSPYDSHIGSHPGSPPELSHSSPPGSARLIDHDNNGTAFDRESIVDKLVENDGRMQDDDLARLLSSSNASAGTFEPTWSDSQFLNLDKELTLPGEECNTGLVTFNDDSLFADADNTYSC